MKKRKMISNIILIILEFLSIFAFLFCLYYSSLFNALQFLFLSLTLFLPSIISFIIKKDIDLIIVIIYDLFLLAHFVLGEVINLYVLFNGYDNILHFCSSFCICLLSYFIINKKITSKNPVYIIIFSVMFALLAEYLWEIIEFSIDHFCGTNMQRFIKNNNVLSGHLALYDTIKDMIIALFGSLTFVLFKIFKKKKIPN